MGHSKADSCGGHRMLSIIKECKRITESRSLSLLLTLSLVLIITSTLAEAMQVKRAGFVGMRGKKDMEGSLEDLYASDPDSEAELYAGPEVYPYSYYPKPRFDNNLNTGRGHAGRNWTKSFLKSSLIHIPNPLLSQKRFETCL